GRVGGRREEGADFGNTEQGWFFGFKLHPLRHLDGRGIHFLRTPGHLDDRLPAPDLWRAAEGGIPRGDLGDRGKKFQDLLIEEAEMLLLTRADATDHKKLLSQIRPQIETTFSP